MPYILEIVALTGRSLTNTPHESERVAGTYVAMYDPAAHEGQGEAVLTPYARQAVRFDTIDAARAYWAQEHGIRPDGHPNRPLSAFTVRIVPAPE